MYVIGKSRDHVDINIIKLNMLPNVKRLCLHFLTCRQEKCQTNKDLKFLSWHRWNKSANCLLSACIILPAIKDQGGQHYQAGAG